MRLLVEIVVVEFSLLEISSLQLEIGLHMETD